MKKQPRLTSLEGADVVRKALKSKTVNGYTSWSQFAAAFHHLARGDGGWNAALKLLREMVAALATPVPASA